MGELADKARQQSKFLSLNMDESLTVKYIGYRFLPSNFDPTQETVQYEFELDGHKKFWTNGSTYIMRQFDPIPKDSLITITRNPFINKQGQVVENKSTYTVEKFDGEPPKTKEEEPDDNPF